MKKILAFVLSAIALIFASSCKDKELPVANSLKLSPDAPIELGIAGGARTIAVATDMATWDVASSQEWCVVAKLIDGKSFTVTAGANVEKEPRTATVTVTAKNGTETKSLQIAVGQAGSTEEPFVLAVENIAAAGFDLAVAPIDKSGRYYYDIISKADLKELLDDNLATYIDGMMAKAIEINGTLEAALAAVSTVGDDSYSYARLKPNTDYVAFAVGLSDQGKPSTRFVRQDVKTLDNSVEMTFAIDVTKKYFDGFDYAITPSNAEAPYYTTIRAASKYQGMDAKLLAQTIIGEDSFMIDYMTRPGVHTYENENVWNTGTTYIAIAFGYADGVATTPATKFEITTEDVELPVGANFTFGVRNISSRSADVDVTPSADKAMYLYDLMSEAMYEKHKNNLTAYVEGYAADIYLELDDQLNRGESSYGYQKMLRSNAKYYVWAAYFDQTGKIRGSVTLSDAFSTLPAQVSSAGITSSIEKYFNGDDLYALDPVKYAQLQGKVYAFITFKPNADAKVWYGVMVVEDPNDPTSDIPDAEMAFYLESGAGIWGVTGKAYICKWDVDYTALGVAVGGDENFGAVLRDKYKFTKAGASPISEFVEPTAVKRVEARKLNRTHAQGKLIYKNIKKAR